MRFWSINALRYCGIIRHFRQEFLRPRTAVPSCIPAGDVADPLRLQEEGGHHER